MSINLSALMKQRYDTAANWTAQNPTLLAGEIGIESDTKKWKVGTGSTAWTSLTYAIGGTYPIVNADIAAAAAIAYSKLATLTSGNIVLGSAANVATSTAVTGDVTISNTGVTAIASGVIVNADINASAAIVDTKLATIATAGKVSNSATTATSANTASAIVARDASGNFTAGTITAALTGAASSNVLKAGDTMTGVLAVTAGTAALPGIAVSGDTNTGIYSPGADQLAISTGGTGRLTVSTTAVSSTLPLAINGASATATLSLPSGSNINAAGPVLFYDTNSAFSSGADRYIVSNYAARYIQDSGAHVWQRATSGTAGNAITFLGSMKLDDNGRLLLGTTSILQGGANNFSVILADFTAQFGLALCSTQATGTAYYSQFVYNGSVNGSISSNGTTTTYAITSDYRLKENVIPVPNGIARFKQLKPSRFNFISHPSRTVDGFIAHEAQAVVPECVTGEKDAVDDDGNPVYQGIDQSKLVPLLTAALQEAIAKIEALETRLSALEAA